MAGLNTALDYLQSSMYTPEQQAEQSMLAEQARLSDSGLRRGILRGVHTTPALLANAAGQVVEPLSAGLSQPLFDYAQGEMQQAQQIPSLVPSYENVTGLRSGMRYVGEKIGENLPNMLVTAPFGVAGRVGLGTAAIRSPLVKTLAGASVGALPLQMGEMTQSMREDPAIMASTTPLERLGRSTAYGVITAPMEAADEALMLARGTGAGKAVKNIFKDGIKQGAKAAGARLIGAVPEAALTEGVPEVAQEATQHAMLNKLNPSRDASKDTQQLKEAFFGGWAAGGGTSVAGRGAEVAWSNARGMQQKIGELLSAKQLPSWLRSADDRTVLDWDAQDDARRTASAEEVAGAMAGDETEAPEFRAQAADWLRRAQEGTAGWQDFASVAAAREKYHAARKGAERFLAAAKGAWGDLGKEGKNLEFTPDDRIVFDAMRSAMDPASPLAKDEQRAVGLYNYLKQFLADNRTDVPVHALEDDFGGPEGLQGTLEAMRALLQRAGAVQPDATFKERMTAMLADGRQRDLARAKLVLSNLKLEHGGELSPTDAIVMAQRIEDGLQRYPSMTAKQRAAFDKRLDEVFGVNAESVVEALGYQKQRDEVSLAEDTEDVEGQPNPAMQTIFEQRGVERRFIGSAKAAPDDPLHGGLWRLDHPDEETRADIRKRMARTMRAERGTGNIVRSLNPKQYAEAAGVNLEELAQRLKTTVENLEAHPARMLMSDEKLLDKDRIDLSTEDVQRLAKNVVTELSQRVDEDVAANVEAALKQPAAEQRKTLREMGLEHAVKVVRTKDGSVVKSNLSHGGAGRFTVKLQNGTELVLSAQELIKEMRKRVNEPKAKRPGGDADLLRHFAAGISSLLSNPDVASITVNDVWAREHTKERVRKESRAENKEAQNAYTGLVGRFGGYFQLAQEGSRRVTLMQAVRAQERGGDPADYENVREKLENYPTVLLEGHLKRIEGLLKRATARMQKDAGKKSDGANLRRYRTILDAGRDILDEREEGPEQQNATVYEIQEDKEEEAQRKVRTHQEETGEPLHPHGRRSEKAPPKATGSLSEQRQPMDVPKGVSGKHFTPALRSLEAQVEKLYDLAEGKFQTALDSVLELVAQAADAVREGDKAKYAKLLAQGQERLAKIAEGMLQRLEERGKAEQNAVKRGALRKEYTTVKNVLSKEATSVKDGKIEEAKTLSKEAPKLAAQIREAKPGALGSKENPHSVPMSYTASPGELRPELRKKYAGIKKIAELIASGDRTGTTRNPQQGVLPGHYVTFPGVPGLYRVTGFEKIDLNSPEGIAKWEEREGWDRGATKQRFAGQVEHGKLQMVFERAEEQSAEAIVNVSSAPAFARAKEAAKAAGADYVLAAEGVVGSYASRIAAQARAKGKLLTAESINEVKAGDVVYVSVPGASRPFTMKGSVYGLVPALLDRGAVVRMDTNERAHSTHNRTGEGVIYDRLKSLGYYEVTENQHYAEWRVKKGVTHTQNNAQEASKPAGETISDTEMQRVKDYVAKVLGPQVATEFVNRLTDPKTGRFEGGSAQWIRKNGQAIIRIVARAANPMSKAHHEAMHEFFQRLTETNPEAADILRKAAGSATVLRQIERFFHAEPNREQILKQLKNSEHERVAYMFQLWAAGELNVGPKTENLFQRIVTFLRKTFGMLNEDERAEAIMAAFHEGKMSEPNAVTQVLAKMNRAKAIERYSGEMKEAYRHVLHWVGTASGGLIGNENPHLDSIGRDFYNETGDKERAAFLIARDQKTNQMMNRVASIYADADKKDMDIALEYLQTGKTPADPQVKVLVDRTRLMLDQIYDYLEASETGVKKRKNYFPRVWDVVTLSEQRDQFVADLLQHHAKDLKRIADAENASREKRALEGVDPKNKAAMKRALAEVRRAEPKDIAEGILSTLLENKGADPVQENEWRVGYTPFMQAANRRVLTWIDDKVFHKYYNKDLVHIMTTYSAQAAHAGEYSKKFGRGGQKLRDKLNEALVWEAVRYAEEKSKQSGLLEQARTFAIDGSAGKYDADSSNAAMKMEIMQFLAGQTGEDPQEFVQKQENALALAKRNIMAMEGTLGHDISEAWRKASAGAVVYENLRLLSMSLFSQFIDPLGVMVNGGTLSDAFNTFKRGIVGVVHGWKGTQPQDEMTALARRIGIIDSHHLLNSMGSLYSSLYLGKTARKWNDRLFRWNGVEMFTQQSRVGAMETGIELILHHLKQTDQEQSKRFLDELGLKPEDKRLMKGDELDYTSPEIQQALMRFVDRSIVRPNAAIRPAYGSDPRAQILFHMKGFTYAFHKVILEKIAHEAKHGNYDPAFTAILAYVPVMIAADTVRGLLSTGGDEPDWKKKWTLGDYVTHGVERAGLLGIPQLALDTVRWGPTELTGPASEQIVRAGRTVSKEVKQHERLQKRAEDSGKELDKLLAESDDPVYDASRRILRDALPLGTITKNLLIDQPVDSSRQGLRAAQH
ncbi:MAG: hypothetical protein MOGMAGMI_02614 [Candidatus Omnitrophica bacterium]|nr:hypothetical protein [Candidatus Omnitrophota bacterium]